MADIQIDITEYDTYNIAVITPFGHHVLYKDIKEGGQMPDDKVLKSVKSGSRVTIKVYQVYQKCDPDSYGVDWKEPLYWINLVYDAACILKGTALGEDIDRYEYETALEICTQYDQLRGYVPDLIRWLHDHPGKQEVLIL